MTCAKAALITGGAKGCGCAIVLDLPGEGWDIVLCVQMSQPAGEETAAIGRDPWCHQ